jgi:hypothetical protein
MPLCIPGVGKSKAPLQIEIGWFDWFNPAAIRGGQSKEFNL